MIYPSHDQVKAARHNSGLTQQKSAEAVHQADSSNWRSYESGKTKMHPAAWELYLLKTGQHPTHQMVSK